MNHCGQGEGTIWLASQVEELLGGQHEMGSRWYPKWNVGRYGQMVGDEMQAMNRNPCQFTNIPEQSGLIGMRVNSQDIFDMSKNIHLEVKFFVTNHRRLSNIRSHAVNITRRTEVDGLLEDLKLLCQRITSCSCDGVPPRKSAKEAARTTGTGGKILWEVLCSPCTHWPSPRQSCDLCPQPRTGPQWSYD